MSEKCDFGAIKRAITIEETANWLGLELKKMGNQLRGPCPIHGGERSMVLTPAMDRFTCFGCKPSESGDVISLVAHVHKLSAREAALELQKHLWPQPEKLQELEYLIPECERVQALGLPAHVAKAVGAGYAPRGIMAGRICLPVRTPDGTLVCYVGIGLDLEPEIKFPKRFFI